MSQQLTGLETIHRAVEDVEDPEARARRVGIEFIKKDIVRHVGRNQARVEELIQHFEQVAIGNDGIILTMVAAHLFVEIQKYRNRSEQWMAEFDEAATEAARDLALKFA